MEDEAAKTSATPDGLGGRSGGGSRRRRPAAGGAT